MPRPVLALLVLVATSLAAPRGVVAQPAATATKQEAADLVNRAVALQKAGEHVTALPLFSEAYALRPDPILLFLKARSHFALAQYAEARDAYVAVRRHPEQVGPRNMLELERNLARCNDELKETRVHVATTGVSGASLLLDGRFVGRTPLDVSLRRGVYTARLEKEGYLSHESALEVTGEAELPFEVALQAIAPGPVPSEPVVAAPVVAAAPQEKPSSGLSRTAWAWITVGASAVVLGTGLGFLGDYAVKKGSSLPADEHWEGTTANLAIGGTLTGVGVALATTAIVLFATNGDSRATESTGFFLVPSPGGLAAGVSGSW